MWATRTPSTCPSAPSATSLCSVRITGELRRWWLVAITTPAPAAASTIALAWSSDVARGFSQSTWQPAPTAACTPAAWRSFVVETYAASTPEANASSTDVVPRPTPLRTA